MKLESRKRGDNVACLPQIPRRDNAKREGGQRGGAGNFKAKNGGEGRREREEETGDSPHI